MRREPRQTARLPVEETRQKSNCALIFANRACRIPVGTKYAPFGMKFWLYDCTALELVTL